MPKIIASQIPWNDPSTWIPGKYYPLPFNIEVEFNGVPLEIENSQWGVSKLESKIRDVKFKDDIATIYIGSAKDCFTICESLNPEIFKVV